MKPVFSFLIGLFGLAAGALPLLAVEDVKPNIVFFLADDLGFMDIGANNPRTFYETPNIDRLAAKGMRFTKGHSSCPVCSPARASLMTGKYPPRTGVTDYISHYGNQGGAPCGFVRDGDWKLIEWYEDGSREVYNLREDPGEQHDVSAANPRRVRNLAAQLAAWAHRGQSRDAHAES
jgi:arylsulfatase A-like enzyme